MFSQNNHAELELRIPIKYSQKREHEHYIYLIEGSLEVKLPTIWTVEKQR